MKRNGKIIFLIAFLVASVITAIPLLNISNSADNSTSQPESAAPVSDLGVRVGDLIYYRVFDSDIEINDDDLLPQGMVWEYEITSMDGEELTRNIKAFRPNGTDYWGNINRVDNYATYQVFDPIWQFRMFQLTTIADYATASGSTVEDLDQAWRDEINSITEPISTTYDSNSNADFHLLNFGGYEDDNPNNYCEKEVWVDKLTGIVTILNETDELGYSRYQELMGYEKGSSSILPDWTYPNPSNFQIGDSLVVASTDIGIYSDDNFDIDEPNLIFIQHTIKFMYRNPATMEDVVVAEQREFRTPGLSPNQQLSIYMYKEECRSLENNPKLVINSLFFDQDIIPTINTSEFGDKIALAMDLVPGYSTVQVGNSLKTSGFDILGQNAEYYIEGLDGYGFPEVQWTKYWNETDTEWNIEMAVDGTGVIENHPDIVVNEGDYWETIVQNNFNSHEWFPSSPDERDDKSEVFIKKYEITHIFALNSTAMAVFGECRAWEPHIPAFEQRYKGFEPLLIYDTDNPTTFLTYGGFATEMGCPPVLIYDTDNPTTFLTFGGIASEMGGAPVLLPMVSDWSTYSTELESQLESDLSFDASVIISQYTPNSIRLAWNENTYESPEWKNDSGQLMLESNSLGIVTHLEFKQNKAWVDGFGKGEEKDETVSMFAYSINLTSGCVQNPPSDITDLTSGDILIWENQRYQQDEIEIYEHDRIKWVIDEIISTCDGSVVFLGERYWREINDTIYHEDYWLLEPGTPDPVDINYWMLSTIRDDDIWSWMQGQIFDKGINDFADYEADLIEMLNFAFELPAGISITTSDITIDSNSFEISIFNVDKDVNHIMKFAVNKEGILQDMLVGEQDPSTGDWLNYERSVLVAGPGAIGEYFDEILPMYNIADLSEDTSDISGYPMLFVSIISFASIVLIIQKSKK